VRIVHTPKEMHLLADEARRHGSRIAVVPTMGALHAGHLSLIHGARDRADIVVVTIFVNPTQFGKGEDFDRYPRNLDRDSALCESAGTEIVFAPSVEAMYPTPPLTWVDVGEITTLLEGKVRPGHFRGVTTVVAKLFNITKPHVAIFGQKDAQQVVVVKRMAKDLNFDVEIVILPTVREEDGLALSSRNAYLTPEERRQAPVLRRALLFAEEEIAKGERDALKVTGAMAALITGQSSGTIDYISIADNESLEELSVIDGGRIVLVSLAVRFGTTRLIDNVIVSTQRL
jgi:pantoate--beta-alanine ligase